MGKAILGALVRIIFGLRLHSKWLMKCCVAILINSMLKKLEHKGLLYNNRWQDFHGTWAKKKETEAFKKLEDIVKALMG